jgi:nitroimidazol reductase NimA-like FMN-containing flavoprotein (pyridoxamine 5'-phosphate oxidase superfamily)
MVNQSMRRKERETTDPTFMQGVLADAREMFLALNYIARRHHCAMDTRVGFFTAVDIAWDGTTTLYRSVCGTSRAKITDDATLKNEVLKVIDERFQASCRFPVPEERLEEATVVRVEIDSLTGKYSRRGEGPNSAISSVKCDK